MAWDLLKHCRPVAIVLAWGVSHALVSAAPPEGAPRTARIPARAENLPAEHPLTPVLGDFYRMRENLAQVRDYECLFINRERIDGKLGEYEQLRMKVRHEPFSVYAYFEAPKNLQGREAIYVEGRNNGKLLAHGTGLQKKLAGTLELDPTGPMAMRGTRYPFTEAGIKNLNERLIQSWEYETGFGESEVQIIPGAKVDGRPCTCVQISHPVPRKTFQFHVARVFVDDKYQLPVRTEFYDWPKKAGEAPALVGEYTFSQIKFNRGLTDADFDAANPNYSFPR
jgi:hypothetical protein